MITEIRVMGTNQTSPLDYISVKRNAHVEAQGLFLRLGLEIQIFYFSYLFRP